MKAIGIDLGGTRIKSVVLDEDGRMIHESYTPTNDGDLQGWKSAVLSAYSDLIPFCGVEKRVTGISAPGIPDEKNSCISVMPGRLQGLERFDWSSFLGTETVVINDANAAMAAELKFGAARGTRHAILLTLGTGVGGSIAINGNIYQGAFQKAGHLGHMTIAHNGAADICGMPGSLEDAIGNCTIVQRSGGRYSSTHELLADYRKGDPFAVNIWIRSVQQLAVAIASLTNILSPEKVILGGGITEAGKDLFEPLEKYMHAYEWRTGGNRTSIVKAQFGDKAGAVGAAGFALLSHSSSGNSAKA